MKPNNISIVFLLGCWIPGAALGQDVLEEIIVTAEKRTEDLQDTPISMVSIGPDELTRLRINSIADLAYNVPNLSMTPFPNSPNAPRLFIRGVGSGDPQVTTDTSVGVYLDGVYLARSIGLGLEVADIERIEVLRGPQGTLYGRNTTGGAVSIITVRPDETLSFSQELSAGELSLFRSKTVVNLPITDSLFTRLSYVKHKRDGAVANTGEGDDFGSYDKNGLRADVRWLVGDATVDYAYDYSEFDFTGNYYQLKQPNVWFAGVLPVTSGRLNKARLPSPYEPGDSATDGHTLTLSLPVAFGELKSISAYRTLDESTYQDYSANESINIIRNLAANTDQNQLSQELQLVGTSASGSVDYVVGLYYFRERGSVYLGEEIALFGLAPPPTVVDAKNTAYAAYAQATWQPGAASPWEVTMGMRYSVDDRWAENKAIAEVDTSFNEFTPSITVRYIIDADASLYAKVISGYKSGGFNIRAADFTEPFEPETLLSYEVGWKSEWLNRRLRVNAAAFYADYQDMQLDIVVPDQPNPALTQTENAGEASIAGIELDLKALLTPGLVASISVGYLDTEVKKVEGDDRRFWVLQNAPETQVSAAIEWQALSMSWATLSLSADYTYRDDAFTSARPNPPGTDPGDIVPSYAVSSLRATLAGEDWIGRGEFALSAWISNLTDEEYQVEGQGSFYQLHADKLAVYGDPQLFGIDLRYQY